MSGGWRAIWRRSSVGVSPVRDATVMRGGRLAEALRRQADPGQRRPQVALDVVGQGLERRDVQDADVPGLAALRRRARVAGQAVEAPQEGGQGLAAPGRGVDQGVMAVRDRRPALGLGLGRGLEAALEPVADRRREALERAVLAAVLRRRRAGPGATGDGFGSRLPRDRQYRPRRTNRPGVLFVRVAVRWQARVVLSARATTGG